MTLETVCQDIDTLPDAVVGATRPVKAESPALTPAARDRLGRQLRSLYENLSAEELPQPLQALVARLDAAETEAKAESVAAFRADLLSALPSLRAFALSLSRPAQADDLVQETVLKAWQKQHLFAPGTNIKAWLFTILRNQFYTTCRKGRHEVEDVDGLSAAQLVSLPDQDHAATLKTVLVHLNRLSPPQREALILVGAHGMTYDSAAELLGCQVGTVKSRVSRARAFLSQKLALNEEDAA